MSDKPASPADLAAAIGCQTVVLMLIVHPFLGGFALMLIAGIVHSMWPAVPTFAYWPCVAVLALVSMARLPGAIAGVIRDEMKKSRAATNAAP